MRSRLGARTRPPASRLAWASSQARRSPISTLPGSWMGAITRIVGEAASLAAVSAQLLPLGPQGGQRFLGGGSAGSHAVHHMVRRLGDERLVGQLLFDLAQFGGVLLDLAVDVGQGRADV